MSQSSRIRREGGETPRGPRADTLSNIQGTKRSGERVCTDTSGLLTARIQAGAECTGHAQARVVSVAMTLWKRQSATVDKQHSRTAHTSVFELAHDAQAREQQDRLSLQAPHRPAGAQLQRGGTLHPNE